MRTANPSIPNRLRRDTTPPPLQGEELARAFASADAMIFPSTTDTWGNVVLEAQASGLPVVVTDKGGPHELIMNGVTGLMVKGHDSAALAAALRTLMDEATRLQMGRAAREFTVANRVDEPYSAILDSERYRQAAKRAKKQAAVDRPVESVEDYLVDHRIARSEVSAA